jgi:hypothetical protein
VHFEIYYDMLLGTIIMSSLQTESGIGNVYQRLQKSELHELYPGDQFVIGLLEFQTQRFNTGIVSEIG